MLSTQGDKLSRLLIRKKKIQLNTETYKYSEQTTQSSPGKLKNLQKKNTEIQKSENRKILTVKKREKESPLQ